MTTNQTTDHVLITHDDQGPILAIATWFLLTVMFLAVAARMTIKIAVRRQLKIEDYSVMAALLFGIGQSVAVSLAVKYGLGQRQLNLDPLNLISIEKAQYAADLMYILAVALSKVSILQFLKALAVSKIHRNVIDVSIYIVITWAISVFFSFAFQCGASRPWASLTGQCIHKFVFWAAISPVDVLTEVVVILLPIFMMMPVQVTFKTKLAVVIAFFFRIIVIITTIIRLVLLRPYFSSNDMIFNSIASGIASQCLLSMAITTACVPSLKPFLDGFESGMLGVTIKQSRNFNSKSYEMDNSVGNTI